jgi:hypothetical protein
MSWPIPLQTLGYAIGLGSYLSVLEKSHVCAGHKVLIEVDGNSALIVGDPWGILGK